MSDKIHINDLFLWCNSIDEIRSFYSEILSLKEIWIDQSPKSRAPYVVYELSNKQKLHFLQKSINVDPVDRWSFQSSSEIPGGTENFSWTLEFPKSILEAVMMRIKENNIPTYQENIESRSGYSAVTVRDPMGNTIDLYYLHTD
jgi:catechol-2,3-dioxygenase